MKPVVLSPYKRRKVAASNEQSKRMTEEVFADKWKLYSEGPDRKKGIQATAKHFFYLGAKEALDTIVSKDYREAKRKHEEEIIREILTRKALHAIKKEIYGRKLSIKEMIKKFSKALKEHGGDEAVAEELRKHIRTLEELEKREKEGEKDKKAKPVSGRAQGKV